jgi:chromosome segregation ATPase
VAELDVLITRFDEFDKRQEARFQALNTRFDDVNHRLDDFTGRLTTLESRMTSIDTRLDGKANQGLVNFWGGFVTAWTSILVGTVVAVLKLWP